MTKILKSVFPTFSVIIFVAVFISLVGCNSSTSGPSGGDLLPKADVAGACDQVFTDSKINDFNKNQVHFQIKAAGYMRRCMADIKINGQLTPTEVTGYSAIFILPNITYVSGSVNNDGSYSLKMRVLEPSLEDKNFILKKMAIQGNPSSYISVEKYLPKYIYFEKGLIYKINKTISRESELILQIYPEVHQQDRLRSSMAQLYSGEINMSVLWPPVLDTISQVLAAPAIKTISWSHHDVLSLLELLVSFNGPENYTFIFQDVLDLAEEWKINVLQLHSRLPQILAYANTQWENPVVSEANAKRMAYYLKYIVAVDGASPGENIQNILDTYVKINKFQSSERASLQTAIDFSNGVYTPEQFSFLLETSSSLHQTFAKKSWLWAQALGQKTNFDATNASLLAKLTAGLYKRGFPLSQENFDPVISRLNAGINTGNVDIYFLTFDSIKSTVKATLDEADQACLTFIPSGRLTEENRTAYIDLFNWLEDNMSLKLPESVANLNSIGTSTVNLNEERSNLIKKSLRWLTGNVKLSKTESLSKMPLYFNTYGLTEDLFNSLKREYAIFIQQGMEAFAALAAAEAKVFIN